MPQGVQPRLHPASLAAMSVKFFFPVVGLALSHKRGDGLPVTTKPTPRPAKPLLQHFSLAGSYREALSNRPESFLSGFPRLVVVPYGFTG